MDRPVIRLPQHGLLFTRIDRNRKETSMVVRPRAGWEALRAYMTGEEDGTNKRRCVLRSGWRIVAPAADL